MALHPVWIPDFAPPRAFPDVEWALDEPNGLLAMGGDLSPERLLYAYRHGIFPWFSSGQPILWWSPNPRMVLIPSELKVSRSLRRTLKRSAFEIRINTAFRDVMRACAEPRVGQDGTWIVPQMLSAYAGLNELGHAHSVEAWCEDALVGGLYGVAMGQVFFGESMFARTSRRPCATHASPPVQPLTLGGCMRSWPALAHSRTSWAAGASRTPIARRVGTTKATGLLVCAPITRSL